MFAATTSATILGVEGHRVSVEVHASDKALPGFAIIGQPDEVCREARDRVRSAVISSGLPWPTDKRLTVNLAPSGQRKIGSGTDLAIALGVLIATGHVPAPAVERHGFVGELGLDGSLRHVPGIAPAVAAFGGLHPVVPVGGRHEAEAVADQRVFVVRSLREVVDALAGDGEWPSPPVDSVPDDADILPDLADVRGQSFARHALEVAAAGGHHVLLVGPPGSGKSMLAQRFTGLLPPLDADDSLVATLVHSAAGLRLPPSGLIRRAPLRAPHHTTSLVAMVGGGTASLRPGEISLSHGGALFLDEMGEFAPTVLDGLRQPLEEGVVHLARARASATLPARFQLIGATNPCPCGGGPPGACECDDVARAKYLRRLSGPLLDRFDLRVAVDRPHVEDLLASTNGEPTAVAAARVQRARQIALQRQGCLNASISPSAMDQFAPLSAAAQQRVRTELERGRLTGRGYHRVRRVARSLADLDASPAEIVDIDHIEAALQFRVRLTTQLRGRAA